MPLEFGWNRDLIIPGLYLLTAILYFISGYRQENIEYVEWNDELIVVKPYGKKRKEYQLSEIENLTISNNHLIIKAHNASGTMVELKDYHSEDISRFYKEFGSAEMFTQ
ncbi:MAG: hypothetical protein VX712_10865 [Bacteroidota bacterium]|nr:hypothetical protein [Bacteroidota bacterium]